MNFARTQKKLLKHCISAEFLLVEGYLQSAVRKELRIFESTWNNLLKKTLDLYQIFTDGRLCTGCSTKRAAHCSFRRAL